MPRGITLVELLLALSLSGILASLAVPAVSGFRDRYTVQSAAAALSGAHQRARIRAVLEGGGTELEVRSDSLILRRLYPGLPPAVVWSGPGPAAAGVTLTPAARTLAFAPTGVPMGFANATFSLVKGAARRQVIISRMGRLRITP